MKDLLTKKEAILLVMICDDCLSDKQIASERKRSINTIRNQKQGLYRKMGVQCAAQLVKKYHTQKKEARVIQMFKVENKKTA